MPVVPFKDPQSSKDSSARDVSDSWFDDESEGGKMSFLEHLDELRKRIIRALLSLSVGVAIAAFFLEDILNFVMRPLAATLPPGANFIFTYPTEAFMLRIRIALIAGLFIATPLVFWQVWQFVAPALYAKGAAVRDSLRGCCRRLASSAARRSHITWRSRSCGGSSRASRTR